MLVSLFGEKSCSRKSSRSRTSSFRPWKRPARRRTFPKSCATPWPGAAFLLAVGARRGAGLAVVQRVLGQLGFPVEVRGRPAHGALRRLRPARQPRARHRSRLHPVPPRRVQGRTHGHRFRLRRSRIVSHEISFGALFADWGHHSRWKRKLGASAEKSAIVRVPSCLKLARSLKSLHNRTIVHGITRTIALFSTRRAQKPAGWLLHGAARGGKALLLSCPTYGR